MSEVRLFSYKMTSDTGFAPNPFGKYLTLATCKPGMRRTKREGDWIAGFTSKTLCGHAVGDERPVYLMRVDERLSFAEYFVDRRFASKIPDPGSRSWRRRCGDNIYAPDDAASAEPIQFAQLANPFHVERDKPNDLSGEYVLISRNFVYYGDQAKVLPDDVRPAIPRGQSPYGSCTHDNARAKRFIDFVMCGAGDVQLVLGDPIECDRDGGACGC